RVGVAGVGAHRCTRGTEVAHQLGKAEVVPTPIQATNCSGSSTKGKWQQSSRSSSSKTKRSGRCTTPGVVARTGLLTFPYWTTITTAPENLTFDPDSRLGQDRWTTRSGPPTARQGSTLRAPQRSVALTVGGAPSS